MGAAGQALALEVSRRTLCGQHKPGLHLPSPECNEFIARGTGDLPGRQREAPWLKNCLLPPCPHAHPSGFAPLKQRPSAIYFFSLYVENESDLSASNTGSPEHSAVPAGGCWG